MKRQCDNQLDKRHERGVMRGDGAMSSGGAGQMGGSGVRRGYATTSRGTRGTRWAWQEARGDDAMRGGGQSRRNGNDKEEDEDNHVDDDGGGAIVQGGLYEDDGTAIRVASDSRTQLLCHPYEATAN